MISKIIDGIEENVSGGSASGGHINAESVGYDNTESELQSTNVQDAIDEVNSSKISKSQTAGLVKNDGTIDTNTYAKSSISNLVFSVDNDGILNVTYNT